MTAISLPLRSIQGRVHGATGAWAGSLDAAAGPAACPQAVQSAVRPVRACRSRGWRIPELVRGTPVPARSGTGHRRPASGNLPGISSAPEARQLLRRTGAGNVDESEKQQLAHRGADYA